MIETFSTFEEIQNIKDAVIGQQVYCEETNSYYVYTENEGWSPIEFSGTGPSMSLYDINKSIIRQMPVLTKKEVKKFCKECCEEYQALTANTYYMMLCNELNYYTLFVNDGITKAPISNDSLAITLKDIILELGDVYSVSLTENKDAIEIWIKMPEKEDPSVFYFFAYEKGVVYYE